ncbi:MAG: sulfurtransferase [Synergistaceae bacterium]|nr:sulfurtransferase [Synergistaceae bacterium]
MKRFLFVLALALLALTPVWAETPVTAVDSVEVFRSYVGNLDVVMLDLRLEAAYQGWKLNGAARGGHVAGAMDFPLSWLPLLDDAKLGEVLSQKGVAAGKTVVLYGAEKVDERLVAALNKKGVKRVVLFTLPSSRWTTDETIPMVSYPRYQLYVYPEWLKSLMDGGKPDNYDGRPFKVFECSWGEEKIAYLNGHIPGSVHINTDEFEEGPIWNQLSDERLRAAVAVNGITKDTLVVLYSAVQNMAAARIAWILMYCGVEDVRLLDGGFNAWKRAGLPIATESTPKTLAKEFGGKLPAHPELVIDTAAAKSILADPNGRLVSIRSWPEQIGETSGYGWLDRKGRIPGDVWGHSGPDSQTLPDFENVDGTMRNGAEITALWDEWGIHPENRIATFCGTGWRAAEVNFDFYVLGWPNVVLYDGGWCEWSNDPANPVEFGDQKPRFK